MGDETVVIEECFDEAVEILKAMALYWWNRGSYGESTREQVEHWDSYGKIIHQFCLRWKIDFLEEYDDWGTTDRQRDQESHTRHQADQT